VKQIELNPDELQTLRTVVGYFLGRILLDPGCYTTAADAKALHRGLLLQIQTKLSTDAPDAGKAVGK
jgi:hypothetical protein